MALVLRTSTFVSINLQMSFLDINCYTSNHLSLFDIKTPAFKHLVAMKLHDSNHLPAEAVTEQKVVITVMILILSSACNKKRDKRRDYQYGVLSILTANIFSTRSLKPSNRMKMRVCFYINDFEIYMRAPKEVQIVYRLFLVNCYLLHVTSDALQILPTSVMFYYCVRYDF